MWFYKQVALTFTLSLYGIVQKDENGEVVNTWKVIALPRHYFSQDKFPNMFLWPYVCIPKTRYKLWWVSCTHWVMAVCHERCSSVFGVGAASARLSSPCSLFLPSLCLSCLFPLLSQPLRSVFEPDPAVMRWLSSNLPGGAGGSASPQPSAGHKNHQQARWRWGEEWQLWGGAARARLGLWERPATRWSNSWV